MSEELDAPEDTWRAHAEAVAAELDALCETWSAMPDEHPHRIHALFAELYLCTTRCWLARLSERRDSEYAYRVICHFLGLYKTHVLSQLEHPLDTLAPHWRSYHRMARRQTIKSPISSHLILISVGARAHTHGDLGHAMYLAEEGMGQGLAERQTFFEERRRIFGKISDGAFINAALDYVMLHHSRQTGWRRLILSLYRVGLVVLKPVWLTVFHQWRRTGYDKAVRNQACGSDRLQDSPA